jgi:hypothetical protein
MSESVRHISIEFGKFKFVLDGFETPGEGVETAVDLIRKLADLDIDDTILATLASHLPDPEEPRIPEFPTSEDQAETAASFAKEFSDGLADLTVEEGHPNDGEDPNPTQQAEPDQSVEFHSKRLHPKTDGSDGDWQQELARLEHSINSAILSLKSAPAHDAGLSTQAPTQGARENIEQSAVDLDDIVSSFGDIEEKPEIEPTDDTSVPEPDASEDLQPVEEVAEATPVTASVETDDFPQTNAAANTGQSPKDPVSQPENMAGPDEETPESETASDPRPDVTTERTEEEPASRRELAKNVVDHSAQFSDQSEAEQDQPEAEISEPVSEAASEILPEQPEQSAIARGIAVNKEAIVKSAISQINESQRAMANDEHYQPVEDQEIERLMDTTNALLDDAEHTRKSRSLERLKAAVVATEAERSIKVRTSRGTVTLDFDAPAKSAHHGSSLILPPEPCPEMRTERLAAYRKMIAARKFGS